MVDPSDKVAIDLISTETTPTGIIQSREHRAPGNSRSYRILILAPTSFFVVYGCHVRTLEAARVLQRFGHRVTIDTDANGNSMRDLDIRHTLPGLRWLMESFAPTRGVMAVAPEDSLVIITLLRNVR